MAYRCDRCGKVEESPFECFGMEAMIDKDHPATTLHAPLISSEWEQPEDEEVTEGDFALSVPKE